MQHNNLENYEDFIHASLFTGIGGFDIAAEWMGWHNLFFCENNEIVSRVLKYYWNNSISYEDITKTDFSIHRGAIDILTGGFPCQPYSHSGKRKGKEDHRHLWPEMLRAIREIQPPWVVGENVPGIITWNKGMVFEEVCTDLENEGYEVQPIILPALSKNAPHRRDRVFFIAYSDMYGHKYRKLRKNRQTKGESKSEQNKRERIRENLIRDGKQKTTSNTGSKRFQKCSIKGLSKEKKFSKPKRPICSQNVTNTNSKRLRNKVNRYGKSGFSNYKSSKNDWENFPTQSPICSGDDGIPLQLDGITFPKHRQESLKGYGNAVVPQVVYEIFKIIQTYENQNN